MTTPLDYDHFVDRIYETAIDPSLWPDTLKIFAEMMGGSGATLRWCDAFTGAGTGSNSYLDPMVGSLFFDHFVTCNPLHTSAEVMRQRLTNWDPRVRPGEAWMARDDYLKTEFYNDFATKFALDWDLSIDLDAERTTVGAINVFRGAHAGDHPSDNLKLAAAAQPHLIRALKMGRRVASPETLDRSSHACFLLGADGRVRHLNSAAARLISRGDAGLKVIGGRLVATHPHSARRLEGMIGKAAAPGPGQATGGSMGVAAPDRRLPLSVMVSPVRSERLSPFFYGSAVMVCVIDVEAEPSLPEDRLRNLFGLSVAESRVALALFEGLSLREAADALEVSYFTIRGHLARIFDKTGVNRQADLMRLMLRAVSADLSWIDPSL